MKVYIIISQPSKHRIPKLWQKQRSCWKDAFICFPIAVSLRLHELFRRKGTI